MLEERRKQLYEVYQLWEAELKSACPQLISEKYSHPYYLHIPDEWFDAKHRILIVGEEGFGNKQFDLPIAEAQAFNRDYLKSQLGLPNPGNYSRSTSPFWNRVRAIADTLLGTQFSITWTNLDKIHYSGTKKCKLEETDRLALHSTPTQILLEEISILQPTHVIYFGWYGISLEKELPEIHKDLYSANEQGGSKWKSGIITPMRIGQVCHLFTYHPNWGKRQKRFENNAGYEDYVVRKVREELL